MKTRKHKIASIVLLIIFSFQQVSWACGYNLSLLVNPPPSPLIYKDHGEFNRWVAKRVYSLTKPSFRHNPQELKSAYQWLKQPATETVPCSAYVLYNFLQAQGIKPKIEDISALLISHDLKAGNLKPPFTQNKIYNSLYSLAKTAESQGLTLYPARLNSITPESLNSQTPFIAHLSYAGQSGHFVLVTKIDTEKVYFFYDKGDTFLPYEKFLEEFSGYCLLSSILSVGTEQCSVPAISDSEAKSILGAGRTYHGRSVNISSLFKKPSTLESVIGIGTAIGGAFTMGMGGSGWGSLAATGIKIGGSMLFKDSQWGQIGTSIVAGAVGGGINGGMGAESANMWKEAFQGAGVGAAKSATISGTMYGISQVKIANLSPSVMASIGQLVAVPLGNAVGRGLQMGFDLPLYDGSGNRMGTASQLGIKGGFGTGFWQGLTFQTPESWREKVSFRDKWGGALQHYGSETASIAIEVFAPGKYSSAYGMGLNSAFSVFTNTNDSWSKALGISIGKGVAMGGASLLLANLTKDMRVTEGAFLEKAVSSVAGAGVEAIFGYNKKAEAYVSTSRWGIFSKSLTDNWVNTSKSIVTFGNPSGNFLNYQGGYAIAKMHTFGSDIAALKKGGLKSFDAVRYAWNQYVGSSLHYSAINDFSSIAENRMRGVTYVNAGKKMHKLEPYTDSWLKSNFGNEAKRWRNLTTGEFLPNQTFSKIDEKTGLRQETTLGKDGNVAVINRFDKDNKLVFSLDLDNQVVYGQGYTYDKIGGKEYVYSGIERQGGRKTGTTLKYDHKNNKIMDGTILGIDNSTGLTQKIAITEKGRLIQRFDSAGNKVFELDLANQKVMGKVGNDTVEAFKTYQDNGKSPVITTTISGYSGIKAKTMEAYGENGRKNQETRFHSVDGKELQPLSQTDFAYDDKNNSVTRTITGADGRQQVITQNFEKIDTTYTGSSGYVEKLEAKRLASEDVKFLDANGKQESGKYTTKFEYDQDNTMVASRYNAENKLVSSWKIVKTGDDDSRHRLTEFEGKNKEGKSVKVTKSDTGNDTAINTVLSDDKGDAEVFTRESYNNTLKKKMKEIKTYNLGQESKAEFITTYGDNGQRKTDLTMFNGKGDKIESKSINDFGQVIKDAYEKEAKGTADLPGNVALTVADNFYEKGEYLKAYDKFSGYSAADKEAAAKPAKIEEIKKMDIQSDKLGVWLPGVDTKILTTSPDVVAPQASAEPKPTGLIEAAEKDLNKSSVRAPETPSSASANSASAVPEIREGARGFVRSFHVNDRVFKTYEEAVEYQKTLKTQQSAKHTPKLMNPDSYSEAIIKADEGDMDEGGNTYLSGASAEKPNAVIMFGYNGPKEDIKTDANGRQYVELKKTEQVKVESNNVNNQEEVFSADNTLEPGWGEFEINVNEQRGLSYEPGWSDLLSGSETNNPPPPAVTPNVNEQRGPPNELGWARLLETDYDSKKGSTNVSNREEVSDADMLRHGTGHIGEDETIEHKALNSIPLIVTYEDKKSDGVQVSPLIGQTIDFGDAFDIDTKVSAAKDDVAQLERQYQEALRYKQGGIESIGISDDHNLSAKFNINPDYDKELLNKLNSAQSGLNAVENGVKNVPLVGQMKPEESVMNDIASIPHTQKPFHEITTSLTDPPPYDVDNAKNMPFPETNPHTQKPFHEITTSLTDPPPYDVDNATFPETNPYLNKGTQVNPTLGDIRGQDTLKQEAFNDKLNAAPPAKEKIFEDAFDKAAMQASEMKSPEINALGGQTSTLESMPLEVRGLKLAAAGIGENSAGNKYIEGYVRNESSDTMSDVGQPIISLDKILKTPKVDLQEMSDAQYDRLLSGLEDSSQEYTMIGADAGRDYYSETTEKYKGFTRVERFDNSGKEIFGENVYDDGSIFISGSNDSGHMWKEKDTRDVITTVSTHPDRSFDYVSVTLPPKTTAKVDGTELYVSTLGEPGEVVIKNETPGSQILIDNNFSILGKNVLVTKPSEKYSRNENKVFGTIVYDKDEKIKEMRYIKQGGEVFYVGSGNEGHYFNDPYEGGAMDQLLLTNNAGNIIGRGDSISRGYAKALNKYPDTFNSLLRNKQPAGKLLDILNGEWNNK